VLVLLVLAALFLRGVLPFLAVNAPVTAQVLVVEGWVNDYALEAAVQEFHRGGYSKMYVTGGPLERGEPLSEYKTYAALGAAVAIHFGVPPTLVQAVPAPNVRRDRTYASALALRDWLELHGQMPDGLNLVTLGPHARRSRLLYEKAFGDACRIGVISIEDEGYDPHRWWAYSQGVRTVVSETVAYLYTRFFFRVSADQAPGGASARPLEGSGPMPRRIPSRRAACPAGGGAPARALTVPARIARRRPRPGRRCR
jgi:DUF218 domain